MKCRNCGAEIPAGRMNCPQCGSMVLGNIGNPDKSSQMPQNYSNGVNNGGDAEKEKTLEWFTLICSLLPYIKGILCVVNFQVIWIIFAVIFSISTLILCTGKQREGYYSVAKDLALVALVIIGIVVVCFIGYCIYQLWYDSLPWYEKLDF